MLFAKKIVGNSRNAQRQWASVWNARKHFQTAEARFAAEYSTEGLAVNQGFIPRDVYEEFDNVTVERFRQDDGDTYLNDLLPMSRSINIGKLTTSYRQASSAGFVETSMGGQHGIKFDQVEWKYDGTIVPVHTAGFDRNWREYAGQQSEGFDGLIDDQRETVAKVRAHLADQFLNGHTDRVGNLIVVDGRSFGGMKNDSRVNQIDIGASGINFDFTDTAQTYEDIEAAVKQVRDVIWITNKVNLEITWYISQEIASNIERKSSESYDSRKIIERLRDLMGIADIKVTNKMSGNEFFGIPLTGNFVRPVSGMAINTVALPRPMFNSPYAFLTWGAIGFEVREDYSGNSGAFYASEIT